MLIYPNDMESRLGVDQIRGFIRQKCKSAYGLSFLDKAAPSHDPVVIEQLLNQTDEMRRLLSSGDSLPSRDFQDLRTFINKIRVQGSFLMADDFGLLKSLLNLLYDWTQYLKKHQETYVELCRLTYGFIADKQLITAIDKIVDEKGLVRDNASPELSAIRSLMYQKERDVRNVINKILKKAIADKLTDEDSMVTIREGRLVIPLRSENKRRVQGFVHDESATGQTVYLEPTEVLQLNNEVRELQYREKREIARILIRLSDLVRQSITDLEKGALFIGLIDFIHAKAAFAIEIEAVRPTVSQSPQIKWRDARHPLLWLAHQQSNKSTIPLSLDLNRQTNRILVISGPNAGGKSVTLKTVGLIQYMLQMGLLVPVGEDSVFGLFKSFFLDIGDTQSLENDLSTYSAHLTAMRRFLELMDRNSLFLIDEFGTGTEPQFGGAIAESILTQLNARNAFGVVTTHYQNLKKFAENNAGIINGAMKYDVAALEPLFELEVGKPGSSFAFEIATKIGLPDAIIRDAKTKVGSSQVDYDRLLNELEKERRALEKHNQKMAREEKEIGAIRSDYESLKSHLEDEKKRILKEAKQEAKHLIGSANQKIEQIIREIKENQAEKVKTKSLREGLASFEKQKLVDREEKKRVAAQIKPGDFVTITGQDTSGEVMAMKGKQAQVRFGNIISFIDLKKLEKVGHQNSGNQPSTISKARKIGGIDMLDKRSRFNGEIDVRGMRAEEALVAVDAYIDQALLLGTDQVRVIHGIGHGILRDVIRTHLKGHSSIGKMVDEHIDFGGSGVTVVTFK